MIVAKSIILDNSYNEAEVVLYADTKSEVKDNVDEMTIRGWIPGYKVAMGSQVVTMEGDVAYRKSNGTWYWLTATE